MVPLVTIVENMVLNVIVLQDTSQSFNCFWGNTRVLLRTEHHRRERWGREEVIEFNFTTSLLNYSHLLVESEEDDVPWFLYIIVGEHSTDGYSSDRFSRTEEQPKVLRFPRSALQRAVIKG